MRTPQSYPPPLRLEVVMASNHNNRSDPKDDSFVDISPNSGNVLRLEAQSKHDVIGCLSEMQRTHICATIKADEVSERSSIDLMVVLDVSGSMTGQKLALCQRTLKQILRVLQPLDRFALVSYGSDARIEIPASHVTIQSRDKALEVIRTLSTRGCTNLSAGIALASQEMHAISEPNQVRSIFLLTDGLANEGIKDSDELVTYTRNCLVTGSQAAAMTLHTFGYGTDHDSNLLVNLADVTSGGSYNFVEDDSGVGSAFGNAFGGIMSIVAQSATLNVKIPEHASKKGVRIVEITHDQAIQRSETDFSVVLGDFYAGESRDVVMEITLAENNEEEEAKEPIPHIEFSLAYADTVAKEPAKTKNPVVCSIARPPSTSEISPVNPRVQGQLMRVQTSQAIATAQGLAKRGNVKGAREQLLGAQRTLQSQGDDITSQMAMVDLDQDLNDLMGTLSSREVYAKTGSKLFAGKSRKVAYQRADATSTNSAYANASMKSFSSQFSSNPS